MDVDLLIQGSRRAYGCLMVVQDLLSDLLEEADDRLLAVEAGLTQACEELHCGLVDDEDPDDPDREPLPVETPQPADAVAEGAGADSPLQLLEVVEAA